MTDTPFDNHLLDRRTLIGGGAALAAGALAAPFVGSHAVGAEAETGLITPQAYSVPAGASRFVPLDPIRLCDTREPAVGTNRFTRHGGNVISVPITGRPEVPGVPANASAVVVTITVVNRSGANYVTAFPWGMPVPFVSNLNLDRPGQIMSNLATVRIGAGGQIGIYSPNAADVIVDIAGVYEPVTGPVRGGRMFIRSEPVRVIDTRGLNWRVPAGQFVNVVMPTSLVPTHAVAVVVNITATEAPTAGFFTAYPVSPNPTPPWASNLNLSGPGDTRATSAIVKVGDWGDGQRAFRVFASHGGHIIVDLAGFVTGDTAAEHTDGLFVPSDPIRVLNTENQPRLWPGWEVEFGVPQAWARQAQGVAMNLTTYSTRGAGFLTAYAAGSPRPYTSNLNPTAAGQTIANHVVSRVSTRGVSVYHATGGHVIADLAGYFLGTPSQALLPRRRNPDPPAAQLPYIIEIPSLRVRAQVLGGADSNRVVDAGHFWHWMGTGLLGQNTNLSVFAHRTEANALLRNQHRLRPGDRVYLRSNDGRTFEYLFNYDWVTSNRPNDILNATRFRAAPTVSLISCTKRDKTPTSLDYRLITTFTFVRWFE